eukprot:CAMPEP_0182867502 /NCGR_PEP_ID=MMETSP0034_2-20130328/8755_1 /TAXON_ID=156128 /ORGANISM="Nephroselmis pyriformis, Strain CCMP717" /LENGTH=50 /DNA_ID=CAMNT_0024999861 /DNA_START=72 /DNA_END=220 /DNA_ORIENTATION=-
MSVNDVLAQLQEGRALAAGSSLRGALKAPGIMGHATFLSATRALADYNGS